MVAHRIRRALVRRLGASIVAAAAVPALMVMGPAGTSHAACTTFKFNGETNFVITGPAGGAVTFLSFDQRVPPTIDLPPTATSIGGVNGRTVDVTLTVPDGGSIVFNGQVNDAGIVNGTAVIQSKFGFTESGPFNSTGAPLVCADLPKQISVTWQEFIGGIRATVNMANNTGQVGCTYSTQGLENFDRRFTLFDDKPTDVTISPAVPLLRVWPVTITCDNGVILETERFY